jgi:DNA-3-methyladenine glycosylase I
MTFDIQPLTPHDQASVKSFIVERWGDAIVVANGEVYAPHTLPGFVAVQNDTWIGLVTYQVAGNACEIVTLDSLREGVGVGTALIQAVMEQAHRHECTRVWLITTNDNLDALRFYQKRGFALVAVHRRAVEHARQSKPSIPQIGNDGIPIRDEIELELVLDG